MKKLLIIIFAGVLPMVLILGGVLWIFGWIGFSGSDSMAPTYIPGKTFTITLPFTTPSIGDVVTFKCLNKEKCGAHYTWRITHRLTAINKDGCMTIIGDNKKYNWTTEPCYMPEDISIRGKEIAFNIF